MKNLLTVRLIYALDLIQVKQFGEKIKQGNRKSLWILYKWIVEKKENIDLAREEIFFKLFKEKWTKEKDYLLRNELKLLKAKIEEIYIANELQLISENQKNQLKLKLYHQLKITDEYQQLFKEIYDNSKQQHEWYHILENSFSYAHFIRLNIPNYAERLQLLQANQKLFEEVLQQYMSEQYTKFCVLQSHVLFQQKQVDNQQVMTHFDYKNFQDSMSFQKNILTEYHIAYANAYKNYDTSTVEEWEQVYALLKQLPANTNYLQNEYCNTLGNLSTICSIRNYYEKSDNYFSLLFDMLPVSVTQQNIALHLNYITNLNKLKKYKEANIQMQNAIALFGNKIKQFSQFKTQEIVTACYLNDIKQLGKLLAVDFEALQPFERVFYRLFYCIYFIMNEEFELALTEIQNLQRSKLMNEIDRHFELIADYFFICIKHLSTIYGTKNKLNSKALQEIDHKNEQILLSNIPMLLNYTPYLWMKQRITNI